MERLVRFVPVSRVSEKSGLTSGRFFEPCGGLVAHAMNSQGFCLYSMANTLALPDEGEILLNRRDGFLRFATRYEPKPILYGNSNQCNNGQVNPSPLGGRGWICFTDLRYLPYSQSLQLIL